MKQPTLSQGSEHTRAVKVWQGILGIPQTGIFDTATLEETKRWQATHGVKATGIVNSETWAAVTELQ